MPTITKEDGTQVQIVKRLNEDAPFTYAIMEVHNGVCWYDTSIMGYITSFLNDADPRPAREQIDGNYAHGGGWRPYKGFDLVEDEAGLFYLVSINYPDQDPPLPERSRGHLHISDPTEELLLFFPHSWFAILNVASGEYEVARLD